MTSCLLKYLVTKVEALIVGVLLLQTASIAFLPSLKLLLNTLSYPLLILLILCHWKRFLNTTTKNFSILLLVGIAVTSILWSAAPDFTSNEVKALVRSTALGIFIAARYSVREQVRILAWVIGLAGILSFFFGLAGFGDSGGWSGIFNYKNSMAAYMTVGSIIFLLVALNYHQKQRWIGYLGFSLTTVLILLSQSKTGYAICCILLCMLPVQKFVKQEYRLRVIIFVFCFFLMGGIIALLSINLETAVVDILGKDLEFNGRLPIWTLLLEKIFERPLLGYGYVGFWTSDESFYVLRNTWANGVVDSGTRFNSHNGYIEIALQLGLVGLSLYILIFITTFLRAVKLLFLSKDSEYFWMVLTLASIFFYNFADPIGALNNSTMWIIFVSIAFTTVIQIERIKEFRYGASRASLRNDEYSLLPDTIKS